MHERRSAYSFYVQPQVEKIGRSLAFYVKAFLLMFLTALFSSMDKLSLNAKKDSIIDIQSKKSNKQQVNIGVDSSGIKQIESARLIAVHIDENINWKNHISHVCSKIAKLSGILCRGRHYLLRVIIRILYNALIYPYLSYSNIAWGNTYTTRLEPIRRLQKKIVRIITFSKFKHTGPLQRTIDFTFRCLIMKPLVRS